MIHTYFYALVVFDDSLLAPRLKIGSLGVIFSLILFSPSIHPAVFQTEDLRTPLQRKLQ